MTISLSTDFGRVFIKSNDIPSLPGGRRDAKPSSVSSIYRGRPVGNWEMDWQQKPASRAGLGHSCGQPEILPNSEMLELGAAAQSR
ncbi:MAG: hypothetical protein ABIG35_03710 [Pseudomonadota bacterium]